ncbi:DNA internalization-related competence protein ComEC/Rec2 [Staphylococcus pseudoxylosus]|uniref:DNA internalization-related competence protein ComEC/Rec2 n=1 Tax=Staphylococcus pseudoxylosus TaxID=2282419 RepID=UPI00398BBB98
MIFYALAYLVGILWLHVKSLSMLIFVILMVIGTRKRLRWFQILFIILIPILSNVYFQYHLKVTVEQQNFLTKQPVHTQAYFINKPNLNNKKLTGNVKIGKRTFKYYYQIKSENARGVQSKIVRQNCKIDAIFKSYSNHPYSQLSLFINNIDFNSCYKPKRDYSYILDYHKQYVLERLKHLHIESTGKVFALISGDVSEISKDDIDKYKDIGIYHLLAISGMHIGTLTSILYFLLNHMKWPIVIIKIAICVILPLYVFYIGLAPSAIRATMTCLLLIILSKSIAKNALNILSLSFIFMTSLHPPFVYHLGFQFSFLITFFILFALPILEKAHLIKNIFYLSLIAQLGSFMISAIYFNHIQWIGIITNLFFVPFYTFILFPFVIIIFILLHFPLELSFLITPLNLLMMFHDVAINLFIYMNIYKWHVPELNEIFITLTFVTVFIALVFLVHKYYVCFIITVIILYIISTIMPHDDSYKLTMLNVNQGDAFLFETNERESILIDTGGTSKGSAMDSAMKENHNIAEYHIIPTLKKHGLTSLDYIIISHPHVDHMGELSYLITKFKIKNIIINTTSFNINKLKTLIHQSERNHIKLIDFKNIQQFNLGKANITLLDSTIKHSEDLNEHSIVTFIEYNKIKMLFMGDATTNNEQILLRNFKLPKIDILKVGHHGSKTSTSNEFIQKIQPTICLVSVGKTNRYHLPNQEVINKLKRLGSHVFQSNEYGEVTIKLNSKLTINTEMNQ